jgi:hypothetical protein
MLLAAALLALAACGREGPEDPALITPGAGIPMGAVGATGVSFDAPTAKPEAFPTLPKTKPGKPGQPPVGLAPDDPMPPDPFESPPDDNPPPAPKTKPKGPHGPKPHSPSETTL